MFSEKMSVIRIVRVCLAEAIGTCFLIIFPCTGILDSNTSLVATALLFGFNVTVVIQGLGHISGAYVNPAVTIAAVINGVLPFSLAPFYIASQLIGSVIGSIVFTEFSSIIPVPENSCVSFPHPNLSLLKAVMIEFTITCALILLCCSTWDPRNSDNTDTNSIKFGLVVAMNKLTAAPLTGASMNPATAFGPAAWNNFWTNHWIYWAGPISGAIFTSLVYRLVFRPFRHN